MAETLVEEKVTQNIYGITPEIREKYRRKLEQMIRGNNVKVFTAKDFDFRKTKKRRRKYTPKLTSFCRCAKNGEKRKLNYAKIGLEVKICQWS